jgi:glyoxylase-like metal-dependent hydrolase (beta-lactamase superfamily II)
MVPSAEFHRLSSSLFIWQGYDPTVKVDVSSTGLGTTAGVVLIDPFAADSLPLEEALASIQVVGVVATNANHARACTAFAGRFAVSVFAQREAQTGLDLPRVVELAAGGRHWEEVAVIRIEGAAPGEIALYNASDDGVIIIGDALINFGAHGFTFLPARYCSNAKQMRKSLRQLLDYRFERILFAHGMPILRHGHARLQELLHRKD